MFRCSTAIRTHKNIHFWPAVPPYFWGDLKWPHQPTGARYHLALPCGVPNKMLTVQDRWTWCCWVMMMAKGVRARPTSSSAWVSETSVLRKIRSTTMPRSRTFRPTVSAYSLQLFLKQVQAGRQTDTHTQEQYEMKTSNVLVKYLRKHRRSQICVARSPESRHTFVPCWRRSRSSQQDGQCHSAAGVLHSTVDTVRYADALLVEHVHQQLGRSSG